MIIKLTRPIIIFICFLLFASNCFAALPKALSKDFIELQELSGSDFQFFINEKDLTHDISSGDVDLKMFFDGRSLLREKTYPQNIKVEIYTVIEGRKSLHTILNRTVKNAKAAERVLLLTILPRVEQSEEIYFDIYDTHNTLTATFLETINVSRTDETLDDIDLSTVPDFDCQDGDGECLIEYLLRHVTFSANYDRNLKTEVYKNDKGRYFVNIPIKKGRQLKKKVKDFNVKGGGKGGGTVGSPQPGSYPFFEDEEQTGRLFWDDVNNAIKFNFDGAGRSFSFKEDGGFELGSILTFKNTTLSDTPIPGSIEYDGQDLYFTNETGRTKLGATGPAGPPGPMGPPGASAPAGSHIDLSNGGTLNGTIQFISTSIVNDAVFGASFRYTTGATNGYVLSSDANGNATWQSAAALSGTGDNLGNHNAGQRLNMAGFTIRSADQVNGNTANFTDASLTNITSTGFSFFDGSSTVQFNGNLAIRPGAGTGLILTSDSNGVATWQSAPISGDINGQVFIVNSNIISNNGSSADYQDSFVIGSPSLDSDGDSNHFRRMFFNKSRGAFRAGITGGTQWDDANLGNGSTAFGVATTANGLYSMAWGLFNESRNSFATSWGQNNEASGDSSTAWGVNTTASATQATAWGNFSSATSINATAWGSTSNASGANSTAWGNSSAATGNTATAWGRSNTASGDRSTAFGAYVESQGDDSITFGAGNSVIDRLTNTTNQSLMIGFNSNAATLFVGPAAGTNTIGNVGIGTSTPSATLDLEGTLQYVDGNEAIGFVLTSDATGNASWQAVPGVSGAQTASGPAGAVQFSDGANGFDSDASNFFWDNANGNLGIGTNSPNSQLELEAANPEIQLDNTVTQFYMRGGSGSRYHFNHSSTAGNDLTFRATSNPRLGINQDSPEATLHVVPGGTDNAGIFMGEVGIGTTNPDSDLHIRGTNGGRLHIAGGAAITLPLNYNMAAESDGLRIHAFRTAGVGAKKYVDFVAQEDNGFGKSQFRFFTLDGTTATALERMNITNNGNVGIGFSYPQAKLDLNGSIAIRDGSQSTGFVLSSDATGLASWQNPSTLLSGSATASGPAGAVQFSDGANGFNSDASNFFWDTVNGNLGIGTNTPDSDLHVRGRFIRFDGNNNNTIVRIDSGAMARDSELRFTNTADRMVIYKPSGTSDLRISSLNAGVDDSITVLYDNGNVGIKQTNPSVELDINGSVAIRDGTEAAGFVLTSDVNGNASWQAAPGASGSATASGPAGAIQFSDGSNGFDSSSGNFFWDGANGRLGVGTDTPVNTIHAVGAVTATSYFTTGSLLLHPTRGMYKSIFSRGMIRLGNSATPSGAYPVELISGNGSTYSDGYISMFTNGTEQARLDSSGRLGLGFTTAVAKLDINGSIAIRDGTQATGFVLTSDANGLASWQAAGNNNASGANGSVQFAEAGALASDENNFFWNNSTKRLGLGRGSAAATLHVNGYALIGDSSNNIIALGSSAASNTASGSQNINAFGDRAGRNSRGIHINFMGQVAGDNNNGDHINAFGSYAAHNNTGDRINALGDRAGRNNTGNEVNAFGTVAADANRGDNVNAFGSETAQSNNGDYVNALGHRAAMNNFGSHINAMGYRASRYNISDNVNAFGNYTAYANNGSNLNALGFYAALNNLGAEVNALGANAARSNTGDNVNALGANAAQNNTQNNVNAFGRVSAHNNLGSNINAMGEYSAQSNNGNHLNAIGYASGRYNTGLDVNAIGHNAAYYNTGDYVDSLGSEAARYNSGTGVVAIGRQALLLNNGDNNIAIGNQAGTNLNSGANNILIGAGVEAIDNNGNNSFNIGNTLYGNLANGELALGIATNNPGSTLLVNGSFTYTDGTETAGFVLTSDANGLASWQDPSSILSGSATASGAAGAIQFSDGANGFNSSAANFFWDNANGYLAIGNNTPEAPIHIRSTDARFLVERTGGQWVRFSAGTVGTSFKYSNTGSFSIGPVALKTDSSIIDNFYMAGNGDIGINTSSPTGNFEVNGSTIIDGVISSKSSINNTSGAAVTVDWNEGNRQEITLGHNATFTFTDPTGIANLTLFVIQDGTGSRIATWPASVHWSGGTAPTLTTTAGQMDIISCVFRSSVYYCQAALDFTP